MCIAAIYVSWPELPLGVHVRACDCCVYAWPCMCMLVYAMNMEGMMCVGVFLREFGIP